MKDKNYKVKIKDLFEGPMDLLVYLIKKNELDIYDIPIAFIIEKYMEYIEIMKSLNIDIASDFIVMASYLIQIKSRMLIPSHNEGEEDEFQKEIIKLLIEYLQMKVAADEISKRDVLDDKIFKRNIDNKNIYDNEEQEMDVGLFELIDAFNKIINNKEIEQNLDISIEKFSVEDRISELSKILKEKNTITFDELFNDQITKNVIIITFLAVLEMTKEGIIKIAYNYENNVIRLLYNKRQKNG